MSGTTTKHSPMSSSQMSSSSVLETPRTRLASELEDMMLSTPRSKRRRVDTQSPSPRSLLTGAELLARVMNPSCQYTPTIQKSPTSPRKRVFGRELQVNMSGAIVGGRNPLLIVVKPFEEEDWENVDPKWTRTAKKDDIIEFKMLHRT
ncbi:hypothetical protein HDU79_010427 [Rhizoclosmatium sp. JEL0117]|nr:hypothetical protein HDU79_010427 [Rhizoclosmatium sp. JEL0117]